MSDSASPHPPPPALDIDSLYREHAAAIYAWACLRLQAQLRAFVSPEDLAQEIWLRATRVAAGHGPDSGPPRAWLFTIAKNVLYEVQRAAQEHAPERASGGTTRFAALGQVPSDVTSLTQRLARDDGLRAFLARAAALDAADRMLLVHVGLEAVPQTEAAVRLGIGHEALAKRWQRLRERVRAWPAAHGLL